MSKDYDVEQKIIDDYYKMRENPIDSEVQSLEVLDNDFSEKLRLSMYKMDMLNEDNFELDINIMGIIAEGEKIKDRKKGKRELFGFIALAASIMTALMLLCFYVSPRIFIYWQGIVFTLLPFSLIPLALMARNREEV